MQSKELRIGNLVYAPLNELAHVVQLGGEVKPNYIEYSCINSDEYGWNGVKPIPLTEEWCIKFGFQKDLENTIYKNINKHCFLCYENNIVTLLEEENNYCLRKIKFVHQLQNLYFALTGEELELKAESKP